MQLTGTARATDSCQAAHLGASYAYGYQSAHSSPRLRARISQKSHARPLAAGSSSLSAFHWSSVVGALLPSSADLNQARLTILRGWRQHCTCRPHTHEPASHQSQSSSLAPSNSKGPQLLGKTGSVGAEPGLWPSLKAKARLPLHLCWCE